MKILHSVLLSLLLIAALSIPQIFAESSDRHLIAFKISVADNQLARKIAISYHHAILEMNYQQGYIIADLSQKEIKQLQAFGLKIEKATEWNQKYQQFKADTNQQVQRLTSNAKMAGIPGFDCYPTVEETLQQGNDLSVNYPQLSSWIDIGDSWNKTNGQPGFDLMVLKISNKNITKDKPKLFIHSSMHAREYTPAALTLDFATHLLENYNTNADIQWLVDYHEIHILFHMNPDGRKIAETGILQRKNTNNNYCPSSSEGDTVGVDLNRNFAYFWDYTNGSGSSGNSCDQTFRGLAAESEPETQAVSNYIRSLFIDARGPDENDAAPTNTSGMHLDIHSYSELVLWPYGHKTGSSPNDQGFVALGNKLAWFNNYTPMQSVGLYPTDGTSDDVSYGELGVAAFTFELGTSFFQQCSDYENTIKPNNLNALIYAAKATAAPYTLAFGPEVSKIESNGSIGEISLTQGAPLTIAITADSLRTKQSTAGRTISKAEYSIDIPIWQASATIIEFSQNDGDLTSGVEIFSGILDTSKLSLGRHTIFTRAYDLNNNVGVTSAEYITIATNNSPTPEFTFNCNELNCNFDATTSTDTDGTVENYQWDLGDNSSATGVLIEHNYTSVGDKTVTLTIDDNSGNQASKQLTVSVRETPAVNIPTNQPASSSSGSGAMFGWLVGLLFVGLFRRNSRQTKFHLPPSNT